MINRRTAKGSVYDKLYFTDDELRQGQDILKQADEGKITQDEAHKWWERTRASHGYSGGEDGHSYVKVDKSTPGYVGQYANAMNAATAGVLNRGKFTYNPETDPNYQQYEKAYTQAGKRAMDDTIGQVAARTGGLASSYATAAAAQANNQYMAALADKVPELRQLAYDMWANERANEKDNLQLMANLDNMEYARHRDAVSDEQWQKSFDQNIQNADRNFNYGVMRDELSDEKTAQAEAQAAVDRARSQVMQNLTVLGMSGTALDQKLVDQSGYKPEEISAMEKFYKDQKAAAAAAARQTQSPRRQDATYLELYMNGSTANTVYQDLLNRNYDKGEAEQSATYYAAWVDEHEEAYNELGRSMENIIRSGNPFTLAQLNDMTNALDMTPTEAAKIFDMIYAYTGITPDAYEQYATTPLKINDPNSLGVQRQFGGLRETGRSLGRLLGMG